MVKVFNCLRASRKRYFEYDFVKVYCHWFTISVLNIYSGKMTTWNVFQI